MHFNLIQWLFTDPCTATNCVVGTSTAAGTPPETFHFYIPWLIFCSVGVLLCFYYSVEGRKRFVKNKQVIKYMLDRVLCWFHVISMIGYSLRFALPYLYDHFLS